MERSVPQNPRDSHSSGDQALRSKTIFQIAQPPPSKRSRTRLRRPRILLQIRQLSGHSRPLPVLDVLPSSYFAPRLAQRFPRIFKGKSSLGPNDIIVRNSNSAEGISGNGKDAGLSSDEESSELGEVVGTICRQVRRPQQEMGAAAAAAEICLDQGLVWKASSLPRGGYEFGATGADGSPLQARWVRRDRPYRRVSSLPNDMSQDAKRFTFSILNPSARRHPVIASMTSESIEVHDQYPAAVSQNTPRPRPISRASILSTDTTYFDIQDLHSEPSEHLIYTDHQLRSLIVITGIYVSLEEGWVDDAFHRLRRVRDQEMNSTSGSDNRAAIAKANRTSTQVRSRARGASADETGEKDTGLAFSRAYSTGAASTKSSNRSSLSARLRLGKEDHEPVLPEDGLVSRSARSSGTSSQALPPYSKPQDSTEPLRVPAKLPYGKSPSSKKEGRREGASIFRSPSTKSSKTYRPNSRTGTIRPGFRRFFCLPCLRAVPNSKS